MKRTWQFPIWSTLIIAMLSGAAGYVTYQYTKDRPRTYTSSADTRVLPGRAELVFARDVLGGSSMSQTRALMRTVMEVMRSDRVVARAIETLPAHFQTGIVSQVTNLRDTISISDIDGSFILRVSITHENRELAAEFANALIRAYNFEADKADAAAVAAIRLSLRQQLVELEKQYSNSLDAELIIRRDIGALSIESEIQQLERALEVQMAELATKEIKMNSLETMVREIANSGAELSRSGTNDQDTNTALQLRGTETPELIPAIQLTILKSEIAERTGRLGKLKEQLGAALGKQIVLMTAKLKQDELQRTTSNVLQTLYSAELAYSGIGQHISMLAAAHPAKSHNSPEPGQLALIVTALTFVLLASLLAVSWALLVVNHVNGDTRRTKSVPDHEKTSTQPPTGTSPFSGS